MNCLVVDCPESAIRERQAELVGDQVVTFSFRHCFAQYYLPNSPGVELLVSVTITAQTVEQLLVGAYSDALWEQLALLDEAAEVSAWALRQGLPVFRPQQAIQLQPVAIAKPWGREIWFTGIEARGQSLVSDGVHSIPLPWLLSILPRFLAGGREKQLNLLKILDPLPEEVFGDLYFELHEQKQEVYVVTHVDDAAWPDGVGGIRIGFDPLQRSRYDSDEAFAAAFGESVKTYESVRRKIDQILDGCRQQAGVGLNEPVSAAQTKQWLALVPEPLRLEEEKLRKRMDAFKATLPLQVGDVLKVPCYTPHSLLHGVRTIEFQTPVYERQILSFAQKVLTQDHWDTDKALACMSLQQHQLEPLPEVLHADGVLVEEVVSFSDFQVWRIRLQQAARFNLTVSSYSLVIGVSGEVEVLGLPLVNEQAAFIPAEAAQKTLHNVGGQDGVVLVSFPR